MAKAAVLTEWSSLYQKAFQETDRILRRSAIMAAVNAIVRRLCVLGRNRTLEHHDLYLALNDLHTLRIGSGLGEEKQRW